MFRAEYVLALTDQQFDALGLWPVVRRPDGIGWSADVRQWCALTNAPPDAIARLLQVVLACGFLDDAGDMRAEVVALLRRKVVKRVESMQAGKKAR